MNEGLKTSSPQNYRIAVFDFEWTPSSIRAFWDATASDEQINKLYFTRFYSKNIAFLAQIIGDMGNPRKLRVLDYGCGPGYLSEYLAKEGYMVTALDFSELSCQKAKERLDRVNARSAEVVNAMNTSTILPPDTFDLVFSIETHEHLLPDWIDSYFSELYRLMRPDGLVLISTPNQEDLAHEMCICPNCFAKFHQYQHIRSVSASDLSTTASSHGFQEVICGGLDLREMNERFCSSSLAAQPLSKIPRIIRNRIIEYCRLRGLNQLRRFYSLINDGPNLVYVGRKKSSSMLE